MNTLRRSFVLSSLTIIGAAALASAALPSMDVTVSDSAGKLVYQGKTNPQGLFTTKELAPGNYVVRFNEKSAKGGPYALVVSAGTKKVVANSVAASQLSAGGVSMRVQAKKATSVTGQVAEASHPTTSTNASGHGSNAKVKYIDGKKFVWVQGELGSNLGGRWVDANSPEGRQVEGVDTKTIQDLQGRR